MHLISHRGNLSGPLPKKENHPNYIDKALKRGYNVEIDVWYMYDKWFLGHDEPLYEVDAAFLLNGFLWCHAKNIQAFEKMLYIGAHCFWHQEDDVTLTSEGYLWTYPGKELTPRSICVLPEKVQYDWSEILLARGICSDFIDSYYRSLVEASRLVH